MRTILFVKLDTPCTLEESAMHVPQAEPLNFAEALCKAANTSMESLHILMLGTSVQRKTVGSSIIEVIPYFGEPKLLKNLMNQADDPTIIIWQGRHAIQSGTPSSPYDTVNKPTLTEPYSANDFERLQMLKIWQVQCYNLLSDMSIIKSTYKKFFIHTDARLPLLELNKIDPIAVPRPLPDDITLVTQAYHSDKIMLWMNKYGNGGYYPEIDMTKYFYTFEKSMYLPLELLPLISHRKHAKSYKDKQYDKPICQIQSLKYMDAFRLAQLKQLIDKLDGEVILMGRFGPAERGRVVEFGKHADKMLKTVEGTEMYAIPFHSAAKQLSDSKGSLIITDARYARFGLCPNRFIEAIAVGSMPIVADSVLTYCRPELLEYCKTLPEDISTIQNTDDILHTKFADKQTAYLYEQLLDFLETT